MAVQDYYKQVRRMRHHGGAGLLQASAQDATSGDMITATSRMVTVPETAHDEQPNGQGCYYLLDRLAIC